MKQKRKTMNLKRLLFSIILAQATLAYSQDIYNLSTVISSGIKNNFSIKLSRNSEEIAANNFTIGNAGFLPTISLSGRYTGAINDNVQYMPGGIKNTTSGTVTNSLNGSASLSMTIFNGFNVITTYKKLNELKQIGELSTQLTIETYIASIVSVYNNYVQQLQQLRNLEYAVDLSRERLRIDEERYLLGSSSKLQVLQSKVYLNSDSSRLAKQIQLLRETHIRLNELMAIEDVGSDFSVADTTISINQGFIYEKLAEETMVSNTSLQLAQKNVKISEYDYKLITSRSYPYLDLNGGYGYTLGTNSTAAYKSQSNYGPNAGLTMGVTLFDGFNQRRQIRNSQIEIRNKELRLSELEQAIRADLLTLYSAYRSNLNLVRMEEQNLITAAENLSIAFERYKLGSLSGLDLREVQKSLLDARERLLSVKYQAKLAEISLLQISGRIMDYYN
jgi:outer membrane protein TolC